MKNQAKKSFLLSLILLLLVLTCRTEDDLIIETPSETALTADSKAADLMLKVALNDGSIDNMIDYASNLTVQLPVTVTANGQMLEITDSNGYESILEIFDLSDSDTDILDISYPITVMLPDFSTMVVKSKLELEALSTEEDEVDEDIECIDFVYPITASIYNQNRDAIESITINDDRGLYNFIEDLKEYRAVSINFPINLMDSDGSNILIDDTIQNLANAIEAADINCVEGDNNDFKNNPNNSASCNSNSYVAIELEEIFEDCTTWYVDKLKRDNDNLVNDYEDFEFTFNNDGTITVIENANTYNGTWEATNGVDQVEVLINVVDQPNLNNTWVLCKINNKAKDKQVELKEGIDRLRFKSDCK